MTQLNEVPSIQEQELTKILWGNLPYSVPWYPELAVAGPIVI